MINAEGLLYALAGGALICVVAGVFATIQLNDPVAQVEDIHTWERVEHRRCDNGASQAVRHRITHQEVTLKSGKTYERTRAAVIERGPCEL